MLVENDDIYGTALARMNHWTKGRGGNRKSKDKIGSNPNLVV